MSLMTDTATYCTKPIDEKGNDSLTSGSLFWQNVILEEQTSDSPIYMNELADYSIETQNSIRRGLSQVGSIDRGSFSKYLK